MSEPTNNETQPVSGDAKPPTDYTLTEAERTAIASLHNTAVAHKARIFDLQTQLETAQSEFAQAQARIQGALELMLQQHGFASGELTPDLSKLIRRG